MNSTKPTMSHTDEFAIRVDLSAIEQKLFQIRYKLLDAEVRKPKEILAKIAAVRAQLREATNNLRED
jgi:hypothetical protein